jgi:predicted nucleic acid-binding protein
VAGKYQRPCFDSSVFLGGLNEEIVNGIKRRVVLDYLWDKAKSGEFSVFISALAIAETFKKKNHPKSTNKVLDEFLDLINEDFVRVIELDRETALVAHQLCRQFASNGLMPSDAIHLACALRAGCDILLAWDGPLTTVTHSSIKIEEPRIYDRTLWTLTEVATPEEVKAYEAKRNPKPPQLAAGSLGATPLTPDSQAANQPKADSSTPRKEKEELNLSKDVSSSPEP